MTYNKKKYSDFFFSDFVRNEPSNYIITYAGALRNAIELFHIPGRAVLRVIIFPFFFYFLSVYMIPAGNLGPTVNISSGFSERFSSIQISFP